MALRGRGLGWIAVAAMVACAACTTAPTPPAAPASGVAVDSSHAATLDLGDGSSVTLPAGGVTGSGTLAAKVITPPSPAPAGMVLVGPTYDLQLNGATLSGSITANVHDPTDRQGVEGGPDAALLGYFDPAARTWAVVEGSYDEATHVVTARLPHLSIYSLIRFDSAKFLQEAKDRLTGLLDQSDDAAQPSCPDNAKLRAGGASVVSDSGQIVKWCADGADNGDITLKVANNRHYAVEADYPSSWRMRRVGSSDTVVTQVVDSVSRKITATPAGVQAVIIPGGGSVELQPPTGKAGTVSISPSPPAYLASALLYGVDTFAMTFAAIPGTPAVDPTKTAKAVSLVFDSKDCLASFDSLTHADVSTARGVGDLFVEDLKFATGCLGEQWKVAYGMSGAVGSFFVAVALWLVDGVVLVADGVRAAIDSAMYWRTYRIQVKPGAAQNPTLGKVWANYQQGYGAVRPRTVFNGGDPTGLVSDITWTSWGGPTAEGDGTSDYTGNSQSVAAGTQETAHIVAFDLGACDGKSMYQAVEWFYPQHGERFDPGTYINICTGTYVGVH